MIETFCRFCLKRDADPWSGVSSYILSRPIQRLPICRGCWQYISVVEWGVYDALLNLAERYARDRRDGG